MPSQMSKTWGRMSLAVSGYYGRVLRHAVIMLMWLRLYTRLGSPTMVGFTAASQIGHKINHIVQHQKNIYPICSPLVLWKFVCIFAWLI